MRQGEGGRSDTWCALRANPHPPTAKLGPSLDKKLALFDGTLTLMTCCALGTDILQQLELIHAAGICHRDLKPENLCLCSRFEGEGEGDDAWTLIDFGLATALKAPSLPLSVATVPRSGGGAVVGTARYASIAAHQGRPLTPRDDVESLAYVMLYCCRGEKLPWQGLGARYRDKTIRNAKVGEIKALCSPKSLVEGTLAAPLEAFIVKAFEKKPEPDYQQLRFLLTAVATASSLTAATPLKAAAPLRTFTQP